MSDLSRGPSRGAVDGISRGILPAIVLVAFNLIPLAGVLWFDWDLFSILILYWLESGVIGVVNVLKIARAEGASLPTGGSVRASAMTLQGRLPSEARGCLALFFMVHYGIFWMVHGVFVFLLPVFAGVGSIVSGGTPQARPATLTAEGIVLALVALAAYHLLSYWFDYLGRGEYLRVSPAVQMFKPYARVVVLHVTILIGAFLLFTTGQPVVLVALMVVLKTVIDLVLFALSRPQSMAGSIAG